MRIELLVLNDNKTISSIDHEDIPESRGLWDI